MIWKKLYATAKSEGWSEELEKEYNRISLTSAAIRLNIEQKLRKFRMGEVPWSPKLQNLRTEIEVWSLLLKRKKGRKIGSRRIRRLIKKTKIQGAFDLSTEELQAKLNETFKLYKQAKKKAHIWRNDFLYDLATKKAHKNNTDINVELSKLRHIEWQKRTAKNIKRMRKKLFRTATNQVFVTIERVRYMITEKHEIEFACMEENEYRFS